MPITRQGLDGQRSQLQMAVIGQPDIAPRSDGDHLAAVVFHQQPIGLDRLVPLPVGDVGPGTLQMGAGRGVDLIELHGIGKLELAGCLGPGIAGRLHGQQTHQRGKQAGR